jgi:phosphoribosyl 1,2-cyclic phosphodiesterase
MPSSPKPSSARDADHEPAKVRYWGVRGSIPVPGPQTVKFGGNTSCVEVRADGQIVIFDAGTGLRALGAALGAEFRGRAMEVTMLISHMHWDHLQGFPFFAPAFEARNRIRVLGFADAGRGIRGAFAGQMEPPYFPVALEQVPGGIVFEEPGEAFQIGSIRVRTCRTNHPGICHGYRLDTRAGSICYVTDHDAGQGTPAVAELIHEADLVILDAQYTAEEYRAHAGWGHSSMEDAVKIARDARVKRLHLFHHDPSHDDEFLEQMLQKARRIAAGSGMRVEAAREGEQVSLAAKT